jgi:hypothetical protein
MRLAAVASIAFVLALAGRASAEPDAIPPPPEPTAAPAPEPVAPAPSNGRYLSERAALGLSIGGTVVAWGLAATVHFADTGSAETILGLTGAFGVTFGPSFGHWYAGKEVPRGLKLRIAGMAVLAVGLINAWAHECSWLQHTPEDSNDPPPECHPRPGSVSAAIGLTLLGLGTLDDLLNVTKRVRLRNERRSGVAIAPMLTGQSAGLSLAGRF